jgi:hypothetical protein
MRGSETMTLNMSPKQNTDAEQGNRRSSYRLIVALAVIGLLLAAWRQASAPSETGAPGDHQWEVEISVRAAATAGKTRIDIAAPWNTRFLRVVGQNIAHTGWRQSFPHSDVNESVRRITLVASNNGDLEALALFSVHQSATPRLTTEILAKPLDSDLRERFLRDHPLLQIDHPLTSELAEELLSTANEDRSLSEIVYEWVIKLGERRGTDLVDVPGILSNRQANPRERAYTMVALCRAARVPARLVKGLVLKESQESRLHYWVETYEHGQWQSFDPAFGYVKKLPANYLPFAKGISEVVDFSGTGNYSTTFAISNTDSLIDMAESTHQDWRELLDLTRLSLENRLMLSALLLLPFGALLTAVFMEIIGVRSYGVFTPTLLALSLVYVPWQSAALVFSIVLVLGIFGRSLVHADLNRVPRLSIVLTLVAVGIGAGASAMEFLDMSIGGQLVLLPVVIMASLVDRFYTMLDEKGLHVALVRLGWTLLLAIACIPIVQFEALGHFMVRFPELHLLSLAAILMVGLYRGKRLSALRAFAWMDWPKSPPATKR